MPADLPSSVVCAASAAPSAVSRTACTAARARRPALLAALGLAALLTACSTPPATDPTAQAPYCQTTSKGKRVACTRAPAPSLNADAEAKRFLPDPQALTVYVVRSNWADGHNLVTLHADGGAAIETLPDTLVRLRLKPGTHTLALAFGPQQQTTTVRGQAGELRFLRIDGTAWSWASTYAWADEAEAGIRQRAARARLVADVSLH